MKRILGLVLLGSLNILASDPIGMDYAFPKDEYNHYMQIIQRINPEAYNNLLTCERLEGQPCIEEARTIQPGIYREYSTTGYPDMVIKSLIGQDLKTQEETLDGYATVYNLECEDLEMPATVGSRQNQTTQVISDPVPIMPTTMVVSDNNVLAVPEVEIIQDANPNQALPASVEQLAPESRSMTDYRDLSGQSDSVPSSVASVAEKTDEYDFSKEDYDYLMNLIKQANPETYELLVKCQEAEGHACISKAMTIKPGIYTQYSSSEYPEISLEPDFRSKEQWRQIADINWWCKIYNKTFLGRASNISPAERTEILNIINFFSPSLYAILMTVDPTGEIHIQRDKEPDGLSASFSPVDQLPKIKVGTAIINEPIGDNRFGIAHELSHYVLGHCKVKNGLPSDIEDGEVGPGLKANEAFSNAQQRIQESEADRFAILGFGANPDDGIDWLKNEIKKAGYEWQISKGTFKTTHPEFGPRLEQLEQIKYDLSVGNLKQQKQDFDWMALAQEYKTYWDSLLVN